MKTLIASLLFSFASIAHSEIVIKIVDFPKALLVYTPAYVTISVENHGAVPQLVPVNAIGADNILLLQIGRKNEHLLDINESSGDSEGDNVILLQPGKRYLIRRIIHAENLAEEGIYEIRTILRSSGSCKIQYRGDSPVNRHSTQKNEPSQECWRGTAVSNIENISLTSAASTTDKIALNKILAGEYIKRTFNFPTSVIEKFSESYSGLKNEFPASYYTYVAGFYRAWSMGGAPGYLEEIMRDQPDHPLAVYAQMEWELGMLWRSQEAKYTDFVKEHADKGKSVDLPQVLEEYVTQCKQEANRPSNKIQ